MGPGALDLPDEDGPFDISGCRGPDERGPAEEFRVRAVRPVDEQVVVGCDACDERGERCRRGIATATVPAAPPRTIEPLVVAVVEMLTSGTVFVGFARIIRRAVAPARLMGVPLTTARLTTMPLRVPREASAKSVRASSARL